MAALLAKRVTFCGGVARPDNEPQYITDFYFYIGIASLSMDFQQPVRVMALPLRRLHLSKEVSPDRSCPLSSQGCPGAADPSFISTFYRQVRRSSHAHSAASLAQAPHLPIVDLLGALSSCRWVSCFSPGSRSWYPCRCTAYGTPVGPATLHLQ